jgi:hypothetical protein
MRHSDRNAASTEGKEKLDEEIEDKTCPADDESPTSIESCRDGGSSSLIET